MIRKDIFWRNVATQGAVGYGQAPGTVATAMMIPLVYFMGAMHLSDQQYVALAFMFVAFGCFVVYRALPFFEHKDPSQIVIDEAVAFIALFCFLPINLKTIILGFLLFRLFDIYKPLGIAYLERLPGVAGIIMDDLAAAFAAHLVVQILLAFAVI